MNAARWLAICLAGLCGAPLLAGAPCAADLDQSGAVTGVDLALLLGEWGSCAPRGECLADLDSSGSVNGFDLATLLAVWGECPRLTPPTIVYTPVAHEGDPAPGIDFPGVIYDVLGTPQIDAVGDVLFWSGLYAPGLPLSADIAIFHGRPGNVVPIIREGDQAPGLPPGVFIKSLVFVQYRLCETGKVETTARLDGPGITPGVNDYALFVGNPRKGQPLTKLLQLGDPAPDADTNPELAGLVLGSDGGSFFGADQSDNGTLALFALLKGPGIPPDTEYKAAWTGPPDDLRLVYRDGMPAPGMSSGVTFAWLDMPSINDLGQLAFRGLVQGPGITDDNDMGRWVGAPGALQLYAATGVPAPEQEPGVTFVQGGGGGHSPLNNLGYCGDLALIQGSGIDALNNLVLCGGPPGDMTLVMQEGDPVPEAGEGVEIESIGNSFVSDLGKVMFTVKLRGPSIDATNEWGTCYGPYDNPVLTLRNGDPAPFMPEGTIYSVAALGSFALNESGNAVTVAYVDGPGVTSQTDTVLLMLDPGIGKWFPILQGGQALSGRTVHMPDYTYMLSAYWQQTGGSDGYGLSLNDSGQLAIKIPFTDDTEGIFIVQEAPARK